MLLLWYNLLQINDMKNETVNWSQGLNALSVSKEHLPHRLGCSSLQPWPSVQHPGGLVLCQYTALNNTFTRWYYIILFVIKEMWGDTASNITTTNYKIQTLYTSKYCIFAINSNFFWVNIFLLLLSYNSAWTAFTISCQQWQHWFNLWLDLVAFPKYTPTHQ